jgi:hypothetical protein
VVNAPAPHPILAAPCKHPETLPLPALEGQRPGMNVSVTAEQMVNYILSQKGSAKKVLVQTCFKVLTSGPYQFIQANFCKRIHPGKIY